jgi:hypothetical protein
MLSARKHDPIDAYKRAARFIPCVVGPFVNILQAFQIGLRLGGPDNDCTDELLEQL